MSKRVKHSSMIMLLRIWLVALCWPCSFAIGSEYFPLPDDAFVAPESSDLKAATFEGLQAALRYLEENYELLNLDAITILRICEGRTSCLKNNYM